MPRQQDLGRRQLVDAEPALGASQILQAAQRLSSDDQRRLRRHRTRGEQLGERDPRHRIADHEQAPFVIAFEIQHAGDVGVRQVLAGQGARDVLALVRWQARALHHDVPPEALGAGSASEPRARPTLGGVSELVPSDMYRGVLQRLCGDRPRKSTMQPREKDLVRRDLGGSLRDLERLPRATGRYLLTRGARAWRPWLDGSFSFALAGARWDHGVG